MPILAPAPAKTEKSIPTPRQASSPGEHTAWTLLGWVGGAFLLLGLGDILIGWYPFAFGNTEWEFGTISGTLNAFALPMLGLYFILASGLARGSRVQARTAAVLMSVLLVVLAGMAIVYLMVAPIALRSAAPSAALLAAMKKGVAKSAMLAVGYGILLLVGAIKGFRGR